MRAILVANPKGGCGKTTLAVNIAGWLAGRGNTTFLWDLDRQRSSFEWLALRPAELPVVTCLDARNEDPKLPRGDAWLVLDSPAGLHGKNLVHALKLVHKVLVPIQPSLFDMAAAQDFLARLAEEKAVRKHKTFVAMVGMRVDPHTRVAATLESFLRQFDLPVVTFLRDTVQYANAALSGKSIFDLAPSSVERDVEQWQPLIKWLRVSAIDGRSGHPAFGTGGDWRQGLQAELPGIVLVFPRSGSAAIDVALWKAPRGVLASLPRLRLICSLGMGSTTCSTILPCR
jgi:chromosome partitioning protein